MSEQAASPKCCAGNKAGEGAVKIATRVAYQFVRREVDTGLSRAAQISLSMKTKVFITVDTEFSIGGAFADPVNNKPVGAQMVVCEIDGKSHGLGFLLDTFATFGIKATFFVEAFNTYYFGDEPMRDLALRIKDAAHDVQLHLHPCWTYFKNPDWAERLTSDRPTDHMNGRSVEQLKEWLSDGVAIFERWGLGRPTALRTGSMIADRSVYTAMELVGIWFGSNIGLGVYRPDDPSLHFFSGVHRVGSVTEVCVLTYADFAIGKHVHHRLLTITGASWKETRTLLLDAHESNVESVVILTHPFEYVKYDRSDFTGLLQNRINQGRLSHLCEFLREHGDRYEVANFGDLASRPPAPPSDANVVLKVPVQRVVERMVQNGLNDRISSL